MPRLSRRERWQAFGMLTAGVSTRDIAAQFNCSHSTIVRLNQRVTTTGTGDDRPRTGQPRVTTQHQDQFIRLTHLRDRFQTASNTSLQIQGRRGQISAHTVRRRLHSAGLSNRRPHIGTVLSRLHRTNRLAWAQQNVRRRRQQWRSTMFSDESRFNVSFADRRLRVWRRPGERFSDACVIEHDRFGGGSVHVWGGFSYNHRTPLHVFRNNVTANVYINEVLRTIVVPMFRQNNDLQFFQHDNARPHTANATRNFLAQQQLNVMNWPSRSPDMNPIEHAWDELGRRARLRNIQNANHLEQALVAEWNAIPQHFFQRLCNSMRSRCQACVVARGGHTRYWSKTLPWPQMCHFFSHALRTEKPRDFFRLCFIWKKLLSSVQ